MFQHDLNHGVTKSSSFHWFVLSFIAGSVNAGGFLACQRFVTHITGFATLVGVGIGEGVWTEALAAVSVPMFFILGVMIAGWLTLRQKQAGRRPHYATTMALVAVCLFIASLAGNLDMFGVFGTEFIAERDYVLVAILCMASGLQNAAISNSSGATVRTTHLTGITTDLGLGLVEAISVLKLPLRLSETMIKNAVRIGVIFSFMGGSIAGSFLFLKIKYLGFLLPSGLAFYTAVVAHGFEPKISSPVSKKQQQK